MPVKFTIQITKEIIAKCKEVGVLEDVDIIGNKCPLAIALKNIFPDVHITNEYLFPFGMENELKIHLPLIAQEFIREFDWLCSNTEERLKFSLFEFEIEIQDEIINVIDIDEMKKSIAYNQTSVL